MAAVGPIEQAIAARPHDLGALQVGRVLPSAQRRSVGPFVFLDHLGPLLLPTPVPRSADVRPHPHIGLATVTYLFDGELTHRDSLGVKQVIRPGEVNWMTAGRGISHSERFDTLRERGGALHGLQAWVALPREHEEDAPAFEHYSGVQLQDIELSGARVRLIAGAAFGAVSAVRVASPLLYAHLELAAGARLPLPQGYAERALYLVDGALGVDGVAVAPCTLAVLSHAAITLEAAADSRVMLLGGEPVGERFVWWNFVASSRERIERARADWAAGRWPLPPDDHDERIPLPAGRP